MIMMHKKTFAKAIHWPMGVAIFLCAVSLEGYAMGGLSKVMFSEVRGVVLQNGKPVAGARVVRSYSWAWNDAKKKEEVTTGVDGRFQFPLESRVSLLTSIFPHEPVIYQRIEIGYENKEYLAWEFSKRDYDENGELNDTKISIEYELKNKESYHNINNIKIYGICI